jgi:hypothetical protein
MSSNTIKTVLSLLIIAGCGALAYYAVRGPGPGFDAAPHQGIGKALAEQALALNAGGKIVVLARDTATFAHPATSAQLRALAETLAQKGKTIAHTNLSKLDPLRLLRFPPNDFAELLRKLNDEDVVISLLGPPELNDSQLLRIAEKRPKILALCTGTLPDQLDLKKLFEEQLLHGAIVSRSALTNGYAASAVTQQTFDGLYAVIGTNNLSELTAYAK